MTVKAQTESPATTSKDDDRLAAEWNDLALRFGTVFSTWQFLQAWQRHLGADTTPLTVTRRDSHDRLIAAARLALPRHGRLRVVRMAGQGPADELGPLCAPEHRAAAAGAILEALDAQPRRWDLLLAQAVPVQDGWDQHLGGQIVRREAGPILRFAHGDWDGFLAAQSRNFREQVRSRRRRLERSRSVEFRLSDAATLQADLATMYRLHAMRWGAKSPLLRRGWRAFHHDFAATALAQGWLRLWLLELDDRPVAAWYGFRFGGVDSYYQSGRDPAYDRESVGFVLMAHTIQCAVADGVAEYRLLRGDEPYKQRFANGDRPTQTIVVPRTGPGRGATVVARTLRDAAERRLWLRRYTW